MKSVKGLSLVGISVALMFACVIVLVSHTSLRAQSNQSAAPKSLEGAWWVSVTPYNCTTGAEMPSFLSLLSYARGGTVSETTSAPAFQPGQRSPGVGVWAQTSSGVYTATHDAFILFTAGPFTRGSQRISGAITLADDGDHFQEDAATVQFFDTNGALLMSGCARAVGTRLQ